MTSTAASASTRMWEIEQAPPCPSYKKLKALVEMDDWHTLFTQTASTHELAEVTISNFEFGRVQKYANLVNLEEYAEQ